MRCEGHEPLRKEFIDMAPSVAVDLDLDLFTKNLRSARRGDAGGPIGHDHRASQALVGECGVHRFVWGSGNQVGKRQGGTRDRVWNQIGTLDGTNRRQTVECEALSWEMCFAGLSHAR